MRTGIARSHLILLGLTMMAGSFAFDICVAVAQENNAPVTESRKWNYDEIKNSPEKARRRQNPFENDPDAIRAGGKLFDRHCAECHGMKAAGGRRAPSLLRDEVQQATPGALFWVLTNGVVGTACPCGQSSLNRSAGRSSHS